MTGVRWWFIYFDEFVGVVNEHRIDVTCRCIPCDLAAADYDEVAVFGGVCGDVIGAITVWMQNVCPVGLVFKMFSYGQGV